MDTNDHNGERGKQGHVALEITQLEQVSTNPMTSIKEKLEAISFQRCIFHVPTKFLDQDGGAYVPKMISIGPFHQGKNHLQHMENHKWEYLNSLLSRNLNLEANLDLCIKVLKELEPKIRACYGENVSPLRSDKFVNMMLLDAGFIIELLLRYSIKGLRRRDDSIFRSPEKFHALRNDLILLENQIPFFVLRRIFSLVPRPEQCQRSLSELSLRFFKNLIAVDVELLQEKYDFEGCNHLLDMIWKCYLPTSSKLPVSSGVCTIRDLRSATELQESGIKVKKTEAESILDVKFVNGKLVIPNLRVHTYTTSLFRNLIALEHCYNNGKIKHVTSYVYLMRSLLHSDEDVKLFLRRGIFLNYIENKEEVIGLFKNLCEDVELDKFYYEGMCEQIMCYKRRKRHVWSYLLKRKYSRIQPGRFTFIVGVFMIIFLFVALLLLLLYVFVRHRHGHGHH